MALLIRSYENGAYSYTVLTRTIPMNRVRLRTYTAIPPLDLHSRAHTSWECGIFQNGVYIRSTLFETELGALHFIAKRIHAQSGGIIKTTGEELQAWGT